MKKEHQIILKAIEDILNRDPELRFGQALFNLGINQFANIKNPGESNYRLRDIHGDKDSLIIDRINNQNEWIELQSKINLALEKQEMKDINGMTVNERLIISGLMDSYDKYKNNNIDFARFILERLKVDTTSINNILK